MAINLQKGQTINLRKEEHDLSRVTIGLGWDLRPLQKPGLFSGIFGAKPSEDFDLDAVAILLNENDKIIHVGNQKLANGDVVFFNNLRHRSGYIWHTGDNRTGQGDGDDEQIIVNLEKLYNEFHKIVFLVSIYLGQEKKQYFDQLQNAYIRAVDAKGKEILRFNLDQEDEYKQKCTLLFGEVYRREGGWKFRALGQAFPYDNILNVVQQYL